MDQLITSLEALVGERLAQWPSQWEGYHWPGYTYEHTLRVRDLALVLAEREGAHANVVHLAALLHDICKSAGRDHARVGAEEARRILSSHGVEEALLEPVCSAIAHHAGDNTPTSPMENQCLGDADLIDANFGLVATWRFMTIRSGTDVPWPQTIAAMREWLPKKDALLDRLLTRAGREIARQRSARMRVFCEELLRQTSVGPNYPGFGLLEMVDHIHSDRGRHLLAEQVCQLEALAAGGRADAKVGVVCRSLRLEMAGLH